LGDIAVTDMIRRALLFIALHGPATDQDRWEEMAGINTFTLAATIAALVCGADLLSGDEMRDILLLADDWNSRIEAWCTGANPALMSRYGVGHYYVRGAPAEVLADPSAIQTPVPVRNHVGEHLVPADTLISTDFLQLVRYGLRRPDDPVVAATLAIVDGMLRVETPTGPSWYRYNDDGYGEHADGGPYNGNGRGRAWPLLTGERGHYELVAGREPEVRNLLGAMMGMSSHSGLIPEQVWDAEAVPANGLFPGRPSGSAMPLVWAHAEFMKLIVSLRLGRPFDRPEALWLRYGGVRPRSQRAHWSRRMQIGWITEGQRLRLMLERSCMVHWGVDDWQAVRDDATVDGPLGLHVADLATEHLKTGQRIIFSIMELTPDNWIEHDRVVAIISNVEL
jgi:glucoamylase